LWHFGAQQGFSQQALSQQGRSQQAFAPRQLPQAVGLPQQAGSGQQHFARAQAVALYSHDVQAPQL